MICVLCFRSWACCSNIKNADQKKNCILAPKKQNAFVARAAQDEGSSAVFSLFHRSKYVLFSVTYKAHELL